METAAIPNYPEDVTLEQVWAGLMELKESQKETDRMIMELREGKRETGRIVKETDQQMDERQKEAAWQKEETERWQKEIDRKIGYLSNRFGELAEHLVAPGIARRFNELGFQFDNMSPGGEKIFDEKEHIERLAILRDYWTKKNDTRKLRGAIAGAIFPQDVKIAALKAGLYVLVQSGDTMKLELLDGFVPREW